MTKYIQGSIDFPISVSAPLSISPEKRISLLPSVSLDTLSLTGFQDSSTVATGALHVTGGVGIEKNLTVAANLNFFTGVDSGMVMSTRVNSANNRQLWLLDSALSSSNTTNPVLRFLLNNGAVSIGAIATNGSTVLPLYISQSPFVVQNTTESSSMTTGSVIVAGGLGVSKNLVARDIYPQQKIYMPNGNSLVFVRSDGVSTTSTIGMSSTNVQQLSISNQGGTGYISLDAPFNQVQCNTPLVNVLGTTDSTSTTTGCLVTAGGVGIAKSLSIGGNLNIPGNSALIYSAAGTAAPSFTTRSLGTKIVLYPMINASNTDYAIGIATASLWQSIPISTSKFDWFAGTTVVASLSGAGTFSTSTVTQTSDRRLKDNIVPLDDKECLDKVLKMIPMSFNMKNDLSKKRFGMIAQDIEHILPDLLGKDASGEYLSLNYNDMIAILVGAIKSLSANYDNRGKHQ
jgi:hypothetical protein